uniref:Cyclase/dehydrase n=1 Tax=Solibacter usitatus (strain Ellin6076) TaxID=234267 RepID=Q01V94_SOLUE
MAIHTLHREQLIPLPLGEVFPFFADARNLETITPSWLNFQILTPQPIAMRVGVILDYRLRWHGLPIVWKTEIVEWKAPQSFTDLQIRGPYRLWRHVHTFAAEAGGTRVTDHVTYELPLGLLGELARVIMVRRDLERVFDFRANAIKALLS